MRDEHVFFVPGMLGTELLNSAGEAVWSGDLHQISRALVVNPRVLEGPLTPGTVIEHWKLGKVPMRKQYGPVLKTLVDLGYSLGSHLTPFGYDWRGDIAHNGDALAVAMRRTIESDPRQITIVAHSMGGLVARCALSRHPDLCSYVSQLIQIGTPVRGAACAYADFRQRPQFKSFLDSINRLLRVAYWWHGDSLRQLHEVLRGFDGAFQLLPASDKVLIDEFDEQFLAIDRRFWKPDQYPFLDRAAEVHETIHQCGLPPERAIAYLRINAATPAGYRVNKNGEIEEYRTGRGDGTVIAYSAREGASKHFEIVKDIDHPVLPNCKEVRKFLQRDLQ